MGGRTESAPFSDWPSLPSENVDRIEADGLTIEGHSIYWLRSLSARGEKRWAIGGGRVGEQVIEEHQLRNGSWEPTGISSMPDLEPGQRKFGAWRHDANAI